MARGSGGAAAELSSSSSSPTCSSGILACVPSQWGALPVCLQRQSQALPDSRAVKACGSRPVPACEPSQKGCEAERPQVQNQYSFPSSSWTSTGVFAATLGLLMRPLPSS